MGSAHMGTGVLRGGEQAVLQWGAAWQCEHGLMHWVCIPALLWAHCAIPSKSPLPSA